MFILGTFFNWVVDSLMRIRWHAPNSAFAPLHHTPIFEKERERPALALQSTIFSFHNNKLALLRQPFYLARIALIDFFVFWLQCTTPWDLQYYTVTLWFVMLEFLHRSAAWTVNSMVCLQISLNYKFALAVLNSAVQCTVYSVQCTMYILYYFL